MIADFDVSAIELTDTDSQTGHEPQVRRSYCVRTPYYYRPDAQHTSWCEVPQEDKWQVAMELDTDLVKLPELKHTVGSKWVY